MIEGVYGIKSKLPAVGGNECVAEVSTVGSSVTSLKVGDWVVPSIAAMGTWRQTAVVSEDSVLKVPSDMYSPVIVPESGSSPDEIEARRMQAVVLNTEHRKNNICYAATISVNPCTAYRLLRDFADLKRGDVIMQNGANSMVGQAVVQMARLMGVKTINIVRSDRPDCDTALRLLTNLGGDVCVTDAYVNSNGFREILKDLPPVKLAFNCIGGEEATEMVRSLPSGATVVTYGGMSKKPFVVPFDLLTQRQLTLRGFWMAKWHEEHSKAERSAMIEDISKMIRAKQLTFFYEMHDFDDFQYALKQATEPFRFRKLVLYMDHPDRLKEHDALDERHYLKFQHPVV